ncbi:hypothetical protein Syn7502_00269 [Synechococcus sp. PCC 7502]|uniref:PIN domain-containing protein n=1 Tax=Synechococcus sp. PCC 7502 TaxID=1173263 RepID=UPI00029FC5A1|nr:PIN domain-containing protein [Synechococcus sp. PCC 7502]AFY72436.1 hypothetical protein Syn7502_00269 [Synechococcus sp. PCC 7502]
MTDVILLLDRSAVLSSDSHFWRSASGLGICMIPQAVVDEINSVVAGFGSDKTQEAIASEFLRFLVTSNWQVTDISAVHALLSQKLSNSTSRSSRLDLAIAECAYGLALQSASTVILVTNTVTLIQAINQLNQANLSTATAPTVRTWIQNRQIPTQTVINISTTSRAKTVRNANLARLNKFIVGLISWIVIVVIGLVAWRSLQPKEFNQFWQKTGLPHLPK